MVLIFYFSGRTGDDLATLFPFIDNFDPGHIAAYYVLALLYFFALDKNRSPRPFLVTLTLCLLYGISDEIHQYYVPTRHPDIYDLGRDLLGAGMALFTVYLIKKRRNTQNRAI